MQRRKFVIGVGALASGTAAAVGTGAFSAARMERDANIDVVNDSNGLIGLEAGDTDLVYEENGQLKIDFASDNGGEGVNVNSQYQIGAFLDSGLEVEGNSASGRPAFRVLNQSDSNRNLVLKFELDAEELPLEGSKVIFKARTSNGSAEGSSPMKSMEVDGSNPSGTIAYTEAGTFGNVNDDRIAPGSDIGVSLLIDTTGADSNTFEDLSGTLTVLAEDEALAQE